MTHHIRALDSLMEVAADYDVIVLDQWGVMHDGTAPYPKALTTISALHGGGTRLAVLSNSGKRAAPNASRIAKMGYDISMFEVVMTSGEAAWQDIYSGATDYTTICAITRAPGDAEAWAEGLDIGLVADPADADAILLMGLPDTGAMDAHHRMLATARAKGIRVICTNPDRVSPRAGGGTVTSPGALTWDHVEQGGDACFYGKPHVPIFRALQDRLRVPSERILMVGDSFEHDIEGGHRAGWATAFVRGGLHAEAFTGDVDLTSTITRLARIEGAPTPDVTLPELA